MHEAWLNLGMHDVTILSFDLSRTQEELVEQVELVHV